MRLFGLNVPSASGFLIAAVIALGVSTPASAVTASYDLNVISNANIGTGSQGTVTLTENGANQVDIVVTLKSGVKFVNTGGPHTPFVFNLVAGKTSASVFNFNPSSFSVQGTNNDATPYGTFTNGVQYSGGMGSGAGSPGPLLFSVLYAGGLTIADFIQNSFGMFFAADLFGTGGNTGSVAANAVSVSAVPLPAGVPLLGAGVALLGFMGWRKKRSASAVAA